ncbi:MAG: pyridoxamine 5'-phosphate oxidase family protein [Aigarchaeota archaeon]|nr:pyridoxamine 5'-phosphate oxidase family protein [Aigarchaeota archaeon]
MITFNEKELDFIKRNEICRFATVDENGYPHLVPICYIYKNGAFYMVTDLRTRKLRNVERRNKVALVIDRYKPNKAVMVVGDAQTLYSGPEFVEVSKMFFERFAWARNDPWGEGEAAIIKVTPLRKVSWGLM